MTTIQSPDILLTCPAPGAPGDHITMAHGGGGRIMNKLIEEIFRRAFNDEALLCQHDGAVLAAPAGRIAVTTDSYVVHPLRFPGGTIGTLAVNGTVNDLAMCGATPFYLTCGFLIEEGLPVVELEEIVASMAAAAQTAGIRIVTGDTKVVDRGKGDGLFINTAGVGEVRHDLDIGPKAVRQGDAIILSGDIGRHGMAIMAVREGLEFETTIESDCAPVAEVVAEILAAGVEVHCMRDLTRGGLASALVEIAEASCLHLHIDEGAVPVLAQVHGACEILGLDPLYVANEGRFICICPTSDVDAVLSTMSRFAVSEAACVIGSVDGAPTGTVTLRSSIGVDRIVDMLSGEQLPRIC